MRRWSRRHVRLTELSTKKGSPVALLGELQVNLVAHSKKLVDGFKKGIKATKGFVDKSKKLWKKYGDSIKNITGGVVGGLGVLGVLTKNLAAAGAENVKFANTLGLTLQQLEAFQSGAKRSNVQVDAMNDGLRELSKRSAEATTGTGSMFDALEMMNINVDKFSQMKLWDQYGLITRELDKLDDVARRNFLTDEIFGGTFADVATGLEGSIKGLADQFVRLDKGTSEGAGKSIVALDEDIKELTGSLTQMAKGFLIDISGPATEAVKGLEVIFESLGFIDKQTAKETVRAATGGEDPLTFARGASVLRETLVQGFGDIFGLLGTENLLRADERVLFSVQSRGDIAQPAHLN